MMHSAGKTDHQLLVFGGLGSGFQKILFGARRPFVQVLDGSHLRLQHLLGASEARSHRRVHRAARCGDAEARCSKDGVLLGMYADAEIVGFSRLVGLITIGAAVTSTVEAVGHVLRSAVISGGDDPIVEHDNGADAIAFAVGAQANRHRNVHEIFVAVRARIAR